MTATNAQALNLIDDIQALNNSARLLKDDNPDAAILHLQAIQRLLNQHWPPEADSDFTAELPY